MTKQLTQPLHTKTTAPTHVTTNSSTHINLTNKATVIQQHLQCK